MFKKLNKDDKYWQSRGSYDEEQNNDKTTPLLRDEKYLKQRKLEEDQMDKTGESHNSYNKSSR